MDGPVSETLKWVKQWMTLLNPAGFSTSLQNIDVGLRGERDIWDCATEIEQFTQHLSHPSLEKLRKLLSDRAAETEASFRGARLFS